MSNLSRKQAKYRSHKGGRLDDITKKETDSSGTYSK